MLAVAFGSSTVGFATADRQWTGLLPSAVDSRVVVWSASSTRLLPLRPRQFWDLAAVHKLLYGGRRDDPAAVWAAAHGLPVPVLPGDDLTLLDRGLSVVEGFVDPVRADGSLHPDAQRSCSPTRWASLALEVQALQEAALRALPDPRALASGPPLALVTAWAESAASLLCTELEADGLPFDEPAALSLIAAAIGGADDRAVRDAPVLAPVPR